MGGTGFVADGDRLAVLPDAVRQYAYRVTAAARDHYGPALTGVYLHGSAGFGHFVAGSSDLDLLLTVDDGTAIGSTDDGSTDDGSTDDGSTAHGSTAGHGSAAQGSAVVGSTAHDSTVNGGVVDDRDLVDAVAHLEQPDDVLGLEASVLGTGDLRASGARRPFRAHFTVDRRGQRYVSGVGHTGDPDLVLHYAVCHVAGVSLTGPPAADVFPAPDRATVLRALAAELEWAEENGDWTYAVLNAARAWRYAEESVLSSKLDGALWMRPRTTGQEYLDRALTGHLTPRREHRVPAPDLPGYGGWARAVLRHVLGLLATSS
ncbi:MAG: aminoglycoside adenylyltransferase domain-containing protein [Actinocatenispora sp.]